LSAEQLDELDRLTLDRADSSDCSEYHQADGQFHQLVGTASGLGTALEVYHEALTELYGWRILRRKIPLANFIKAWLASGHKASIDNQDSRRFFLGTRMPALSRI
jgi:DNA-binding GntR family transcriptional regulator